MSEGGFTKGDNRSLENLTQSLEVALSSEALPIRGWVLSSTFAAVDPKENKQWPIYSEKPIVNRSGEIIGSPPIEEYIPAQYVEFHGSFRFTHDPFIFNGRRYSLHAGVVETQVLNFVDSRGMMALVFDPRPVKSYSSFRIVPDFNRYRNLTEIWALKRKQASTNKEIEKSRFMLSQLHAIKANVIQSIAQGVGELANTIRQNEPDYWQLLENVISGKILPEECAKAAKGVFSITLTDRYEPPPKKEPLPIQ